MKFSRPPVNEASIHAQVDFECRMKGAEYLAYPPVVASGNRVNIIHYINNDQIVKEGDFVLMDAGTLNTLRMRNFTTPREKIFEIV